jgi:hypothetical protein
VTRLLEETEDWFLYQVGQTGYVPFGKKYVFKRDVTKGEVKGKAGTTKMFYTEGFPTPRPIPLRAKYRAV